MSTTNVVDDLRRLIEKDHQDIVRCYHITQSLNLRNVTTYDQATNRTNDLIYSFFLSFFPTELLKISRT